ncbi:MAG TPA: flavin reductase family protein [Candidatus Onthousia faecavium]|nr:flavin reductase family protein [Candidatus Onthousia faecavium]
MAKKDLGVKPYLFPMPVLMIATYSEDGSVDVMNMAWGGICDNNKVALNITESHKTSQNIKERGAFTISIADIPHLAESDFFGTVTGNRMKDKFARSGMHATKSKRVDAPIIEEYPITLECKVSKIDRDENSFRVVGEIVNVLADEKVLDENGKVDPTKLNAFVFDQYQNGYYAVGEKVGEAWKSGNKYLNKENN